MINGKKVLSVITARAGSKGLRYKNFLYLGGYPLFLWSVFASLDSKFIDYTIVSSNCTEVEKITNIFANKTDYISRENGLHHYYREVSMFGSSGDFSGKLIFLQRPDELSTDLVKNEAALMHAYKHCKTVYSCEPGIVVNLQPTSPIRTAGLVDRCIKKFVEEKYTSLFTGSCVTPFLFTDTGEEMVAEWDIENRPMRQEMTLGQLKWHDCGSVYVADKDLLFNRNCRLGGKIGMVELSKFESIQIDSIDDFILAEQVLKIL